MIDEGSLKKKSFHYVVFDTMKLPTGISNVEKEEIEELTFATLQLVMKETDSLKLVMKPPLEISRRR